MAAASAREQSHVALVADIVGGRPAAALTRVQQHARRFPTDVLSASTALGAYGLFAFSGRIDHDAARRDFVESLATHLPTDLPWMLMHRGWVRIECGDTTDGLAMVRHAMACGRRTAMARMSSCTASTRLGSRSRRWISWRDGCLATPKTH